MVEHAKWCYKRYPTIVNNIPKDKNKYNNTSQDFTNMDNKLSHAQLAIGESSNLAQIALTYSHNFTEQKYKDIVCILSVLAQVAQWVTINRVNSGSLSIIIKFLVERKK